MSRFTDEFIEDVRSANDIVDVVGASVRLQKKGANFFGCCPFHNEKTGSFCVNANKQMYYCFGCHKGGSVFTFLQENENMTFYEAVEALAERAGIALPDDLSNEEKARENTKSKIMAANKEAATFYYKKLRSKEGEQAYRYLTGRKLTPETINSYGLGYAGVTNNELYNYLKEKGFEDNILKETGLFNFTEKGVKDKFWSRVIFPILTRENRVIAFGGRVMGTGDPKYLNSPETQVFIKNKTLYGINVAAKTKEDYFLLCEGYMDVIALHQAGFTNAVASLGTAFTIGHAGQILDRKKQKVVLTFDSDGAGQDACLRAIPILRERGISAKVLSMKPYKDPDEFIKALGADEYRKRIETARNAFLFEIDVLQRQFDLSDPDGKTKFFDAMAEKLAATFRDKLERENYIDACAKEWGIGYRDLLEMVNRHGEALVKKDEEREKRELLKATLRKPETVNVRYASSSGGARSDAGRENVASLLPQKQVLTALTSDLELLGKVIDVLNPKDFIDELYIEVATMIFDEYKETGKVSPAKILNRFDLLEEQNRIGELLQTDFRDELDEAARKKAIEENIRRVKMASFEYYLAKASKENEPKKMQELIMEQAAWKKKPFKL